MVADDVSPGGALSSLPCVLKRASCPHNCPCEAAKRRVQSQREPTRLIYEVEESEGFPGKIEDGREADIRLANHRLRPLGHLTAARNLSIRRALSYGNTALGQIVPEIVPASSENPPRNGAAHAPGALIRTQRFFSLTTMTATDWRAPLYSHKPASAYLVGRAAGTRSARRSDARTARG